MRPKFCWLCSKKFWGNRVYYIFLSDDELGGKPKKREERKRYVHKSCGGIFGYTVYP